MKILITGGAGFIGSHLAQRFLSLGHHVIALDNLSTGHLDNIKHLLPYPHFRFVEGDVLDKGALKPLIEEADLIYHLAAAVGVKFVVDHLIGTLETNVQGTENVLRLAHHCGGKKVVLASTSEVYGKSQSVPYKEDADSVLGPTSIGRWGYACSKALDEFLALAYYKEQGLPVVILRLFNTVGPRQAGRYGMVVPRFVSQALQGKPITVYGDGLQTRCFTYVGHVVKAMMDIAQVPEGEGQVFNVGSDREVSVNELAALVKETLKSRSPIVHIPYSEVYPLDFEDTYRRVPDISKIQKYIDYQPDTGLAQVIHEVAQYLQQESACIQVT
jgi:UDP-glucose 4-epimerase